MRDWAHEKISNVHNLTRLSTTKPLNISDYVDIVPTSSIFDAMFKLCKRLAFTQAIYITEIYVHILEKM